MGKGAFLSATLHVMVMVLAVVGLPAMFDHDPTPEQPVLVELVTLAEQPAAKKSQPKPKPKPKPKPPPEKKPPPPPPEAKAPPPPPPPPPPEVAPPKAEPIPVAKPKPKPAAKAKPIPKPKPKPVAKKPVQIAKAPPKPRRKPSRPDPLKSLLRNLQQQKQQDIKRQKVEEKQMRDVFAAATPPAPREQPRVSPIDSRRDAMALAQMVMRQVTPCWNVPAGTKDAHTIRVGVRIFLNPDGTLNGPPRIEDQARLNRDPAFRALAESALRALRNPRCSPLRLPVRKYNTWREISFNFDPRELLR